MSVLDLLQNQARVCEEEAGLWKADHGMAMVFLDFQDLVTNLIKAFRVTTLVEERYRTEVYSGKREFSAGFLAKIEDAYRVLLSASAKAESVLPWAESQFGQVPAPPTSARFVPNCEAWSRRTTSSSPGIRS